MQAEIPQMASELRVFLYICGGGMTLLILKEVFSFMKSFKKNGNNKGNSISDKELVHIQTTSVDHALQERCGSRLEAVGAASLASLIQITAKLAAQNDIERNRRSTDLST